VITQLFRVITLITLITLITPDHLFSILFE